ncbi:mechanosensitive ion channel [Pseudenhygromyxa sp. WMMC2535]|uniref:mechanosensitive ion channel family protein n=1 Tax=Pseudenhygromyxa sp. WMMC2535 TaxID=2712867 RepID=UPI00155438FD|nr:mechanosensitive ion channel domain-containing protein [Pseudenhygromyxa sp. WMMC2535]NVB41222.1 mechanosensitive ion channel [Pseudenhygromyxa sp. WMMC2535]
MNFEEIGKNLGLPDSIIAILPTIVDVLLALLILVIGFIVAGAVGSQLSKTLQKRKVDKSLAGFLASLLRWLLIAATVIIVLGRFGFETTSLVALLGSAGIAIGLALQGNLSHFASGVMILLFRPFKVDDYIASSGYEGTVSEIGLFTTTLVTLDNETVIIANSAVIGGPLVNYTTRGSRRAHVEVGVAYGSKVPQVLEILTAAAKRCDAVLSEPEPFTAFTGLGDSSINFTILAHCKPGEYAALLHQVRTAAYEELDKAGIEIPFPQVVVHKAAND